MSKYKYIGLWNKTDAYILEENRVISIEKQDSGKILIGEACDDNFCVIMEKEEAIAMFEEFIDFIKSN